MKHSVSQKLCIHSKILISWNPHRVLTRRAMRQKTKKCFILICLKNSKPSEVCMASWTCSWKCLSRHKNRSGLYLFASCIFVSFFFFFFNRIYREKLGRDTRNAADNAVVFNDVYIVRKYLQINNKNFWLFRRLFFKIRYQILTFVLLILVKVKSTDSPVTSKSVSLCGC